MSLIEITIRDDGEHWHKQVSLFGIPIYHRHVFTKSTEERHVGFTVYPTTIVEVEDTDYCSEDSKRKTNK